MRFAPFLLPESKEVHEGIPALGSKEGIRGQVPIGVEASRGITSLGGTPRHIMHERVDAFDRDVGVLVPIPGIVEP